MPGVRAYRDVAFVDRIASRVLHSADESSPAPHDESPVPSVRQQQLKADMAADDALDFDVSSSVRFFLRVGSYLPDRLEHHVGEAYLAKLLDGDAIRSFCPDRCRARQKYETYQEALFHIAEV